MKHFGRLYNLHLQGRGSLHGITSQNTIILIFTTLGPHISYSLYFNGKENLSLCSLSLVLELKPLTMYIMHVFVVGAKDIIKQTEMIVSWLSSSDVASTVGIY
jgi:hypothetical protein